MAPPEVISLLTSPSAPPSSRLKASDVDQINIEEDTTVCRNSNADKGDGPRDLPMNEAVVSTAHSAWAGRCEKAGLGTDRCKDDVVLLLSDDFDTTGDLDFGSRKVPGTATDVHNNIEHRKGAVKGASPVVQGVRGPNTASRVGGKRWNSVADPIEYSSSPGNFNHYTDPFSSPPKRVTKKSIESVRENKTTERQEQNTKFNGFFDLSSDPFSSSPRRKSPKQKASWDPISSSIPEVLVELPPNRRPGVSIENAPVIDLEDSELSKSEDEFPELGAMEFSKKTEDAFSSHLSPPRKRTKTNAGLPKAAAKTQDQKEIEKQRRIEAKEVERERKRIEKERAKEQKALDKEKSKALAEVNKIRTDKKVSTPEMIVDLSLSFTPGFSLQVRTLLEDLKVQHGTWRSPVDNVIKWRRKIASVFNEDLGYWEPAPLQIENEKHVLVVMQAVEFVELALGTEGADITGHVLKMQANFSGSTLLYLIEGLGPWLRKNNTARNRQFQSAVRNGEASSETHSRRRPPAHEIIDEDVVEDALVTLQVDHGILIHETNVPVETAQWISIFTQHISTIPYRKAREDISTSAGFCVESGQVKTGDGPKDTYVHMLQEISRVTAPMAYGIAAEYATVSDLVQGFELGGTLALEKCKKSANRDGALTDRNIGQAVSKRLHKIFTGTDSTSTDI
ncbi:ERCC4 domain-containing protein [Xylariales sp. PMI_506]|nr:ERCC4 domain-containing protein [Xylariales sp. PMI_506]